MVDDFTDVKAWWTMFELSDADAFPCRKCGVVVSKYDLNQLDDFWVGDSDWSGWCYPCLWNAIRAIAKNENV